FVLQKQTGIPAPPKSRGAEDGYEGQGRAGPSRVGVATAAGLAAATIRSPPRHPRGESVLYYKS
ncbi:hypothetical protein DIJ60_30270, partial [Burkholderia pseudomallei]